MRLRAGDEELPLRLATSEEIETDPTVEALAKVAVGLLEERTNPLGNTGKILAAGAVTDIYLAGA